MVVMPHVSRPLIALLVGTVAFFALWIVALKPQTSGSGSSGKSAPLQSAVDKAHAAVAQSNAASVAHGGTVATTPTTPATLSQAKPSTAATHTATAAAASGTKAATKTEAASAAAAGAAEQRAAAARAAAHAAARRQAAVVQALNDHKVLALLFYNYRAADDRAVKHELATISTHGGKVFKLSIPLRELSHYPVITLQVPVTMSPTLVIVDASHHARTILGFAAQFEIEQRIVDALSVKAK